MVAGCAMPARWVARSGASLNRGIVFQVWRTCFRFPWLMVEQDVHH
jgi:hypothetical protein